MLKSYHEDCEKFKSKLLRQMNFFQMKNRNYHAEEAGTHGEGVVLSLRGTEGIFCRKVGNDDDDEDVSDIFNIQMQNVHLCTRFATNTETPTAIMSKFIIYKFKMTEHSVASGRSSLARSI